MITLQAADLVIVAGRALGLDAEAALALLDADAAEAALAEARAHRHADDPAAPAATLLRALVRHRPFARGNERVAVLATAQFLALNGWGVDLDPPDATAAIVAGLVAGELEHGELAEWMAPRVSLRYPIETCAKEPGLVRWLPSRKRASQRKDRYGTFTDRGRQVIVLAQEEARALDHDRVGTEHLLLGLIRSEGGIAAAALNRVGISTDAVRARILAAIGRGEHHPAGFIPFTPRAKKTLELARREGLHLGHNYVGTEHLLLGLLREGEGLAAQVLTDLDAHLDGVRHEVIRLLSDGTSQSA